MQSEVKKVLVIGLDGAMYYFIKQFAEEGILPNINSLINDGVIAEALPCPPTDTPTNWTTIATGATTATHGVTSFYIHIPGEPFEVGQKLRSRGQLTRYCKAEYLWNAADRQGIPSLVLNYPACWPGNMKHGYICLYTWSMPESIPRVVCGSEMYRVTVNSSGVKLLSGVDAGLSSVKPVVRFNLMLDGGLISEEASVGMYLFDPDGLGYRLAVPRAEGFEVVRVGEWSDWIPVRLRIGERSGLGVKTRGGEVRCLFKVKPIESFKEGLKLVRSEIFTVEGWVDPEGVEEDIIRSTHYLDDELSAIRPRGERVEYDIFGEEASFLINQKIEAMRLIRIVSYFKRKIGWRICFLHYHIMDGVNHRFLGYLYKNFPFYDEKKAEFVWNFYKESYRIIDDFIGLLLKSCASDDTLVVVVSDHAAVPGWRAINIRKIFIDEGLLKYKPVTSGNYRVDWGGTEVFPWVEPLMVWVNLKGRDPQGIVERGRYEEIREQVIDILQGLRDPETNDRITTMILTREESVNIGLGDERTGDVVYFLKPPYTVWCGPIEDILTYMATDRHLGEEWIVRDQHRVTGIHGYYLPNERVGEFSNAAVLIMRGRGVARGIELRRRVELVDVASTISYLLGVPLRDNEGRVLYEALV